MRPATSAARTVTTTGSAAAGHQVRLVTGAGTAQPRNVTSGHPALMGIQTVRDSLTSPHPQTHRQTPHVLY